MKLREVMPKLWNTMAGFIMSLPIVIAIMALFALPVWELWNLLMPTIFSLPEITYLQAFGLEALTCLLFRPFLNTE